MSIQGIDVSVHNGNIEWNKVKGEGIDFAILRAGYGKSIAQKDKLFEANYLGAKKVGIPIGVYWYSYAKNAKEALEEAKALEQILVGKQFELPIFYDLEEKCTQANANEIADTFCSYLESKGYYVGIYASKSYFNVHLPSITSRWCGWVAQWASKCTFSQPYIIWQKSDKGRVDGVLGSVDLDEFASQEQFETVQNIIQQQGLNGYTPFVKESEKKDKLEIYFNGKCVFSGRVDFS